MKKLGLAVSTYSNERTSPERLIVIKESLDSIIKNTPKDCLLCIVDDGSTNEEHVEYLNEQKTKGIKIIRRKKNGGVSYAKNIAIRYLMNNEVGLGFLVDDDLIIKDPGFAEHYLKAHLDTGIHHFNLIVKIFHPPILDNKGNIKKSQIRKMNNTELLVSPLVDGSLLTVTPEMIKKMGYYEIYPHKYGQAHVNYTLRAIHQGFTKKLKFVDAYGSEKYFTNNPLSYNYFADPNVNRKQHARSNAKYLNKKLNHYIAPNF
jgi:glycosyltransferase involved in cell wall biosynthesis